MSYSDELKKISAEKKRDMVHKNSQEYVISATHDYLIEQIKRQTKEVAQEGKQIADIGISSRIMNNVIDSDYWKIENVFATNSIQAYFRKNAYSSQLTEITNIIKDICNDLGLVFINISIHDHRSWETNDGSDFSFVVSW